MTLENKLRLVIRLMDNSYYSAGDVICLQLLADTKEGRNVPQCKVCCMRRFCHIMESVVGLDCLDCSDAIIRSSGTGDRRKEEERLEKLSRG